MMKGKTVTVTAFKKKKLESASLKVSQTTIRHHLSVTLQVLDKLDYATQLGLAEITKTFQMCARVFHSFMRS